MVFVHNRDDETIKQMILFVSGVQDLNVCVGCVAWSDDESVRQSEQVSGNHSWV